jgi:formiminotetrahydrofolate cyclodeaminase
MAAVEALNEYLTKLASEAPVPGGGSAAMVAGAEGCALVAMVARICAGSPKYAAVRSLAKRLIAEADALRAQMLDFKTADKDAMQRALRHAADVPLRGAEAALRALRLAAEALELRNANLVSDVGCAAELAHAALMACAYNVEINHKFMKDEIAIAAQRERLHRLQREANALLPAIRRAVTNALTPAR